ncbi:MAG: hypothetical protein F6K44_33585 [Moorea sp. SIO3E2]|uniref:hypothetical protein n=1 Tax=Moorena sp. SIO4E2 TaxID=2607826 RepID=UPI0013BD1CA2|nr:hypothetical protein [Moorena sp. SIO4E2]NEQ10171.1 hypothetical protein [Moorena sp. SIO4E2]NEQ18332.1 hypothetical protein [Moorena sp. SIO3E2]
MIGIWERTTPTGICGGERDSVTHPTLNLDDLVKCDRIGMAIGWGLRSLMGIG